MGRNNNRAADPCGPPDYLSAIPNPAAITWYCDARPGATQPIKRDTTLDQELYRGNCKRQDVGIQVSLWPAKAIVLLHHENLYLPTNRKRREEIPHTDYHIVTVPRPGIGPKSRRYALNDLHNILAREVPRAIVEAYRYQNYVPNCATPPSNGNNETGFQVASGTIFDGHLSGVKQIEIALKSLESIARLAFELGANLPYEQAHR